MEAQNLSLIFWSKQLSKQENFVFYF